MTRLIWKRQLEYKTWGLFHQGNQLGTVRPHPRFGFQWFTDTTMSAAPDAETAKRDCKAHVLGQLKAKS